MLPSSEYYHQGIDHPIMKAYQVGVYFAETINFFPWPPNISNTCVQDILTNIATLLGADRAQADQDMHDVIAFEIELSMVSEKVNVKLQLINNYVPLEKH